MTLASWSPRHPTKRAGGQISALSRAIKLQPGTTFTGGKWFSSQWLLGSTFCDRAALEQELVNVCCTVLVLASSKSNFKWFLNMFPTVVVMFGNRQFHYPRMLYTCCTGMNGLPLTPRLNSLGPRRAWKMRVFCQPWTSY